MEMTEANGGAGFLPSEEEAGEVRYGEGEGAVKEDGRWDEITQGAERTVYGVP